MKLRFKPIRIPNFILVEPMAGLRMGKSPKVAVEDLDDGDVYELAEDWLRRFYDKAGLRNPWVSQQTRGKGGDDGRHHRQEP